MKNRAFFLLALLFTLSTNAQEADSAQLFTDSIEATLKYQTGKITLDNDLGIVNIPKGYKYLDAKQTEYVLTDLWGNPPSTSLGMIIPESMGVLSDNSWAYNIQYDEIGYVKDDDADDIDYEELLTEMRNDTEQENVEREKAGYERIELVGWASAPFYDKTRKVLHWAKEIKFEGSTANTLNYNIRLLGRKGVLVVNAIATVDKLPQIKAQIPEVLGMVEFSPGSQYADFNPDVDEVAAWTIGGLVAGKVLAKVGFFALLIKFWKFIAIGAIAAGSFIVRLFRRRKEKAQEEAERGLVSATEPVAAEEILPVAVDEMQPAKNEAE